MELFRELRLLMREHHSHPMGFVLVRLNCELNVDFVFTIRQYLLIEHDSAIPLLDIWDQFILVVELNG